MKDEYCKNCPLYDMPKVLGTIVVNKPTQYPHPPELMIVGRDPGQEEIKNGLPFVGRSGKLLRQTLKKLGIDRYYLTNACKCRPPQNAVNFEAGKRCTARYLGLEIRMVMPSKVVVLGNDAQRWVGKAKRDDWPYVPHGKMRWYEMAHPAFIVWQFSYYEKWVEAWKVIL